MMNSLGVAMLWLCPWSGWVTNLASSTLPNGYRVDARITDWYLLKRESAHLAMTRREDGVAAFKLDRAYGFVLWPSNDRTERWHGPSKPSLPDDSLCTRTRLSMARLSGPPSESGMRLRIAGHDAVRYVWRSENHEATLAFAPALGCQLMLFREIQYGRLGLPIGISEFRVTSIRRAGREPDLFPTPTK